MNLKKTIFASTTALACTFGTAANAQVSFVDCVSTPIASFDGNIVDAAIATPELSTLVDAVLAAGLGDALATTENITVYAPTNDAFAAIPSDITTSILENVDVLTAVLTYHVTAGAHDPRKFVPAVKRETLSGEYVYYSFNNGQPNVNNAVVNCAGVRASNGIIWFVDSVLQPGF